MASFGTSIKSMRVALGRSVEELAQAARIPWATLEKIENDEHFPRMHELERLLAALGTSLNILLQPSLPETDR